MKVRDLSADLSHARPLNSFVSYQEPNFYQGILFSSRFLSTLLFVVSFPLFCSSERHLVSRPLIHHALHHALHHPPGHPPAGWEAGRGRQNQGDISQVIQIASLMKWHALQHISFDFFLTKYFRLEGTVCQLIQRLQQNQIITIIISEIGRLGPWIDLFPSTR